MSEGLKYKTCDSLSEGSDYIVEMCPEIKTRPITFGGSTKYRSKYWKYKQDLKKHYKDKKIDEDISTIKITLFIFKSRVRPRYNDLDNFPKPIIDALSETNVIREHEIETIHITRVLIKNNEEEGLTIDLS